jgi:hypothetical protein
LSTFILLFCNLKYVCVLRFLCIFSIYSSVFYILEFSCCMHTSRGVKLVGTFLHHRWQDYLLHRWALTNCG